MINEKFNSIEEVIKHHVKLYNNIPSNVYNKSNFTVCDNISSLVARFIRGLRCVSSVQLEKIFSCGVLELCSKGYSPIEAINYFNNLILKTMKY